jgi:hypothetical protein
VVLSSGNVVKNNGLDIQEAVLVTPKTELAAQQAAVITQTTQFIKKKGCSCDPHIPNPHVALQCVGNSVQGVSGATQVSHHRLLVGQIRASRVTRPQDAC